MKTFTENRPDYSYFEMGDKLWIHDKFTYFPIHPNLSSAQKNFYHYNVYVMKYISKHYINDSRGVFV